MTGNGAIAGPIAIQAGALPNTPGLLIQGLAPSQLTAANFVLRGG